jgi:hypothetical protein
MKKPPRTLSLTFSDPLEVPNLTCSCCGRQEVVVEEKRRKFEIQLSNGQPKLVEQCETIVTCQYCNVTAQAEDRVKALLAFLAKGETTTPQQQERRKPTKPKTTELVAYRQYMAERYGRQDCETIREWNRAVEAGDATANFVPLGKLADDNDDEPDLPVPQKRDPLRGLSLLTVMPFILDPED